MGIALDEIRHVVEGIVEGEGYELVDVELKGAGKQRVLRVFIDREGGITHLDCEKVSDQVSTVLDVEDPIPSAYTLEVSSPGLDRKLIRPQDFVRFEGHKAKVRTKRPIDGRKVFEGRLSGLDGGGILVETRDGVVGIALEDVHEARLAVDWKNEMTRGGRSR
jgi:ribosome maturation factor RimP